MVRETRAHASVSWPMQAVHFYVRLPQNPTVPGEYIEPTFSLSMDAAQAFFEELWAQGFRSKHDRGSSDRLDEARKEHIDDLRKAAKLK